MKRLIAVLFSLAVMSLVSTSANAFGCHGWAEPQGANGCNSSIVVVPPSYQGPADAVSGAQAFWSPARAVTAAFAATGNPIADLVDTSTGTASCTMKIGSNGFADVTSPVCVGNTVSVTTFCTVTHTGCSISKLYEQTGLGVGNAMTQATLASMPTLVLNCQNGLNCMRCSSAPQFLSSTMASTIGQPFTNVNVVERVSGLLNTTVMGNGSNIQTGFTNSTPNFKYVAGGSGATLTVSEAAFHSVQGLTVSNNSTLYIDGSSTTAAAGTATVTGTQELCNGVSAGVLEIGEGGFWNIGMSSGQAGSIQSNARSATNGYNF